MNHKNGETKKPSDRIHVVDPQAVARLKAILAEKGEKKPAVDRDKVKRDVVTDLMASQRRRQAALNASRRKPTIPEGDAIRWHIDHYQVGESLDQVAQRHGVSRPALAKRFRELGLPISRCVAERAWSPQAGEIPAP